MLADVTQMVEYRIVIPVVVGSIPTIRPGEVTQLDRVLACRAKRRGFESRLPRIVGV
jgi:hypothetical protein